MTTIHFLTEWALRSSVLILTGALVLRAFRVKDAPIRMAAWTAMMCGSLIIPALTAVLPGIPLRVTSAAPQRVEVPTATEEAAPSSMRETPRQNASAAKEFDWPRISLGIYVLVACALLLRLCAGLAMSHRLLRSSRATGRMTEGVEIRESDGVSAPVTLGIIRPVVVLPIDWREWEGTKLEAVLAHEHSHVQRKDPAVQLFSAIHRALLWHSPLSWFLHQRLVRVSEEASDDAAVAMTRDRESYAEVLLEFMQRGVRGTNWHGANWRGGNWHGVAMARYSNPAERISRILDGATLSHGVTRWSVLAILALGSPVAYVVATAQARVAQTQMTNIAPVEAKAPMTAVGGAQASVAPVVATVEPAQAAQAPAAAAPPGEGATPRPGRSIRRYIVFSGDSTSGSWDSSDSPDEQELRQRFGEHFVWFRQGRSEYVVTDASVMAQLEEAMAPQKEVNRMQEAVNKQQEVVNQHQENVNRSQSAVNAIQEAVNRRQELINELQAAEGDDELIRRLEATLAELRAKKGETKDQDTANREQAKVNALQAHVNEEQNKVNEQQHKVNEEQNRVSGQYEGRITEILDSAVRQHLAQELK
jgi:beta-lactamase regulating signal transducer with metallopeptidase domain